MNQPPVNATTANTFIVRIWHEQAGAQSRWRGRIDHVQSGEGGAFTDLQQMVDFLWQFMEMGSTPAMIDCDFFDTFLTGAW